MMMMMMLLLLQDGEVFLQDRRSGQQEMLWNPTPEVRRTRLKRQVVQIDQQGPFESERYRHTHIFSHFNSCCFLYELYSELGVCLCSRLWQHVTSAIVERDQNRATQEKFVLEEAQRTEARDRGDKPWSSRLFCLDPDTQEWTYRHMEYANTTWNTHTHTPQYHLHVSHTQVRPHPLSSVLCLGAAPGPGTRRPAWSSLRKMG